MFLPLVEDPLSVLVNTVPMHHVTRFPNFRKDWIMIEWNKPIAKNKCYSEDNISKKKRDHLRAFSEILDKNVFLFIWSIGFVGGIGSSLRNKRSH